MLGTVRRKAAGADATSAVLHAAGLALFVLLVATTTAPAARAGEELKAGTFSPARKAPEFTLDGSDGAPATLARYRGDVVIVVFGFTSCPQVCPTTLSTLAKARRQLGEAASDLHVVYITVDPERDDVPRLREYLKAFDETFLGATGPPDRLEAVRKEYGVFANREAVGTTYGYNHSSFTYLVDRTGNLRALMPYGQPPESYVHDAKILLDEPVPAELHAP